MLNKKEAMKTDGMRKLKVERVNENQRQKAKGKFRIWKERQESMNKKLGKYKKKS